MFFREFRLRLNNTAQATLEYFILMAVFFALTVLVIVASTNNSPGDVNNPHGDFGTIRTAVNNFFTAASNRLSEDKTYEVPETP